MYVSTYYMYVWIMYVLLRRGFKWECQGDDVTLKLQISKPVFPFVFQKEGCCRTLRSPVLGESDEPFVSTDAQSRDAT